MKSRNGYAGYDKNEIVIWSYYYAGLIIDIIAISALENPDELVDCYIKLWQEILESGAKIIVSRERIELLKELTMMVTMQQAKELRKVINVISEV